MFPIGIWWIPVLDEARGRLFRRRNNGKVRLSKTKCGPDYGNRCVFGLAELR